MNNISLLFIVLWTAISCSVPVTWSSSINSMFTARNLMPRTAGVNADIIQSIASGAQMAIDNCKNIFKWDKWNCPESAFSRRLKHPANREQALAHAIVSAGLVHSITQNCSRGELQGCSCNPNLKSPLPQTEQKTNITIFNVKQPSHATDWSWGGCSDDVQYGQFMAKLVLDEMEHGNDTQAFINLHNNFVGRQIVQGTLTKKCKCHGVSGSCSLQTCWMEVAPFTKIANMLKRRYRKAIKIDLVNTSNKILEKDSSSALTVIEKLANVSRKQLVFLDYSPNYCSANSTSGWTGTKGRMCSRSKMETTSLAEKRSCKTLCRECGHRVRKYKRQIKARCNCVFKWCCEVRCETCTETVEEFFCE